MVDEAVAAPGGNDFLVAPTERVNMPGFRVVMHRITVAVPLSGKRWSSRASEKDAAGPDNTGLALSPLHVLTKRYRKRISR